MKQKFTLLLLALLTMSAASPAFAYDFEVDGIYYGIRTSNIAYVTFKDSLFNCYNGKVEIPETVTYDGSTYTVSYIQANTFNNSQNLSLTLPSTIRLLNEQFSGVKGLKSFKTDAAISIPEKCFYGCDSLKIVTLPNATSLGKSCFENCTSLKSAKLPNVTTTEARCFENCSGLRSIELPNVTTVGSYLFKGCAVLKSVKLPCATTMYKRCFDGCENLDSIILPNVTELTYETYDSCTFKGSSLKYIEMNKYQNLWCIRQ